MFQDGRFQSVYWYGGVPDAFKDAVFFGNLSYALGEGAIEMKSLEQRTGFNFKTLTAEEEAAVRNGTFNGAAYKAPDIVIGEGGINFTGTDGIVMFGCVESRYGFNSITVGGDFNMGNANSYSFSYNPNAAYGEGHYGLDVAGVVNMNNPSVRLIINRFGGGDSKKYSDITMSAFVRMGGLNGSGAICNNDPGALSTTIIF